MLESITIGNFNQDKLGEFDVNDFKSKLELAINNVTLKTTKNISRLMGKFPSANCTDDLWSVTDNEGWTTGFWTGQLWLCWELTGDEQFRTQAENLIYSFSERLDKGIDIDNHDLGFLYTLSCVSAWKITGNDEAHRTAIKAAEKLITRFDPISRIIQAWGTLDDHEQRGRMIIDCNMNLPLLFWAAQQTGEKKFSSVAIAHIEQVSKYIVRPDASTHHTYYIDTITGQPKFGKTHQGYSDSSCWARGQAWGIYGFMLSYKYTGQKEYVEIARRLAHYFLNRLPKDMVCNWDLDLVGDDTYRDSSAAAITVCGLLELANALPVTDKYKSYYENVAVTIMNSLIDNYLSTVNDPCEGILKYSAYNVNKNIGVNECSIFGDYFFVEALTRLNQTWNSYW
ncbi:glycoside hydrolase family 88 protein [Scandinavium sp. H11S7]|uniref:Glycoside hydrolase family 88 protein n=1 Tax=Scandinavium hiltneri TaxID=2926519 RepID=A0ABT2E0Z7_9ENTR|nr:glycoside hydrolase family 88 protein [Scandinavium hiltneri]MCS2161556.1 glycoside hydrolase family 88 protein [Scandinavium hiltneri]